MLVRAHPTDATAFRVTHPEVPRFDFSADGVRRSLDESLGRLGVDRVDIVLIHDPDDHLEQAITEAAPVLVALREEGVVRAIGFGMNYVEPLSEAVERCDLDVILVAGRYTLLDQAALDSGLFARCAAHGVAVIAGGVFNSGVLAAPKPRLDLRLRARRQPERLEQAAAIAAVCDRHGTSLPAAALHFVLAQPAVRTVLIGARDGGEITHDVELASHPCRTSCGPISSRCWAARLGSPDPGCYPETSNRLLRSSNGASARHDDEPGDRVTARPLRLEVHPRDVGGQAGTADQLVLQPARRRPRRDRPPQVASVSRKPLSIAFEEISADKITYVRPEPGEEDETAEVEAAEEATE